MMHDVVLPGQGTIHQCPICGVEFEGRYGRWDEDRWAQARQDGPAAVTALLQGRDGVSHDPEDCLGRFLPGYVLANETDRDRAEQLAGDVIRTFFNGTGTPGQQVT